MTIPFDAVVIGAGVAGLAAAWRLRRGGVHDVRLLELEREPGGTSRSGANEVSRFPWGAHYLPAPHGELPALTTLLVEAGFATRRADGGLEFDEATLCRAPEERLFVADRWYEGLYPRAGARPDDLAELERFEAEMTAMAAPREGKRPFAVPSAYGADDPELVALDGLSMADWLRRRGYTSPRLFWYVDYACRDDFGAGAAGTSAWAGVHYFAARRYDGKSSGVLTWPEGNARLCAELARGLRHDVQTGTLATAVRPSREGVEVMTYEAARREGVRWRADHVIVAVPRRFAARLLADTELAASARQFETGAWLVANLTLDGAPRHRGFPLAWDNVVYGAKGLGYVVATHQSDRHGGPPAASVWTYYLPLSDQDGPSGRELLAALRWRDAADIVLTDLRRAHPDLHEHVRRLDVFRWGHAMVRPRPGFVHSAARRQAARSRGRVHFAHSDLSALPLFEEAMYFGVRAAETVLVELGRRGESLL